MMKQINRQILTPCPPRKHCRICEARMDEVFGSADHTNKYRHQANEAATKALLLLNTGHIEQALPLFVRAASFGNLVLNHNA